MKRSKQVALSTSFLGLAATLSLSLTACSDANETLYCGDEHRYVVEASQCEDTSATDVFIYYGYWGTNYTPGMQLKQTSQNGRVAANDAAGRTKIGVPARGGFGGNGAKFSSAG